MPSTIPCSNGREIAFAIVDDDDFIKLCRFSWQLSNGYPSRYTPEGRKYMHHDVVGRPDLGFVTDHINRTKLDNRKENLRHVTQSENCYNSSQSLNGKYIYKHRRRFQVKLRVEGENVFVGSFLTYIEAEAALKSFIESPLHLLPKG